MDKIKMTNREKELELAKKYNAQAIPDSARGNGWNLFKIDTYYMWYSWKGWITAIYDGQGYTKHKHHPSLEDALKYCRDKVSENPTNL